MTFRQEETPPTPIKKGAHLLSIPVTSSGCPVRVEGHLHHIHSFNCGDARNEGGCWFPPHEHWTEAESMRDFHTIPYQYPEGYLLLTCLRWGHTLGRKSWIFCVLDHLCPRPEAALFLLWPPAIFLERDDSHLCLCLDPATNHLLLLTLCWSSYTPWNYTLPQLLLNAKNPTTHSN